MGDDRPTEFEDDSSGTPTLIGGAAAPAAPNRVDATFRNGSLTAISVIVGFSLSFLNRWAALPGAWEVNDLVAVAFIAVGIVLQTLSLAGLLFPRSMESKLYRRAVILFLAGLGLVAIGILLAITADISGLGQKVLGT